MSATVPRVDWHRAFPLAAIAGVGTAVLSMVPILNLGCCLWMLGGGAACVYLYAGRVGRPVTARMGARLGALTGAIGFTVQTVLTLLQMLLPGFSKGSREEIRQSFERSMASNPDPQAQAMMRRMMEFILTPEGLAIAVTLFFLVMFVVFILFCSAGGALGASWFGKKQES